MVMYLNNSSSLNLTTTSPPDLKPDVVSIIRIVISAAICAIGIVGNILVLVITSCARRSKTAVNYYILNLALADIGVLAICYPFTLVKAKDPLQWPLGRVVCEVFYPLTDIFYGASIGSIVAIAIDRYRAIVRDVLPHKTLRAAKWVILSVWTAAFSGIVLPLYFVMEYLHNTEKGTVDCTPVWPSPLATRLYVLSLSTLWYFLPLAVILCAHRKIAQKIRMSKSLHKNMRNMCGSQTNKAQQKVTDANTKALKILVPVVLFFMFTMLPFHVFRIIYVFVDVSSFQYKWVVYHICTALLLTNSAANPIIYSLVSEEFRQRFKEVLCLQWKSLREGPIRKGGSAGSSMRSALSQRKGCDKRVTQTPV